MDEAVTERMGDEEKRDRSLGLWRHLLKSIKLLWGYLVVGGLSLLFILVAVKIVSKLS